MKHATIAIALGSLISLPAFANNEIDAGYAALPQMAAPIASEAFVNAEQGYEHRASWAAGKTRDQVIAETEQARSAGQLIVNAELGTTAASRL